MRKGVGWKALFSGVKGKDDLKNKWCRSKAPEDGGNFRGTGCQTKKPRRAPLKDRSSLRRPAHTENQLVVKLEMPDLNFCGYVNFNGSRKYR
jgi:hypothetical protein